jgi:glycosyltransferase involved in cell wall biosynthesis
VKASILFLTSGRNVPSSRFRVEQYLPRLREEGIRADVAPCVPHKYAHAALTAAKVLSRIGALLKSPAYDAVYLERELIVHLTPWLEEALFGLNRKFVFDFDDAIFLRYGDREVNPVSTVCSLAKLVIAGNGYLADFASKSAKRVVTIPTAIDTGRFRPSDRNDDTLLWTGTSSNLPWLEDVPLEGRKLRVICDKRPDFPCDYTPWSTSAETDLHGTGIMPLPDTDWSRGKCGYKLLQYMACGLPAIASPVGVNREILGEAGLFASTPKEWIDAIERLQDPGLRKKLGVIGRSRAERHYSIEALYPKWRDSLLSVL